MSDGVANVDLTDPLGILDSAYDRDLRNPLRLITIGVGIENYNDYLLEQLAQHGNGWYRYLNDTSQARATFARENWLALSTPFADHTRAQVVLGPRGREVVAHHRLREPRDARRDLHAGTQGVRGAALRRRHHGLLRAGASPVGQVGGRREPGDCRAALAGARHRPVLEPAGRPPGSPSRRFHAAGDPYLQLGAIVALASDRYSTLTDGTRWPGDLEQDLADLNEYLQGLGGRLGGSQAYQDFAFLLGHLAASAPQSSGYSR